MFITALRAAYEAYEPLFTTIDVDAWVSVFLGEALVEFKSWWKASREQYLARMKPFWGFMKRLCWMFENPLLDDKQLASHLWNILPTGVRAQWTNANQQYIDQRIGSYA
uniref:Uncharacterized protein n=1 Tax=Romanomermis culicivorax TaxID=13658 RepID=A0A915HSE7_ROMCU